MTRWRVEGDYGEHQLSPFIGGGTKKCTRWVAIHDGGDEFSYDCVEFETHAQALAYADRQARTVEVVLPRGGKKIISGPHFNEEPITVVTNLAGPQVSVNYTTRGERHSLVLDDDELEPLGLELLSIAYQRKGDKQ